MPLNTPPQAADVLEEYGVTPEFFQSETEALLAAVVMELQAGRYSGDGPSDVGLFLEQQRQDQDRDTGAQRGTYHAEDLSVDASGWTEIDLDFVATEVDLRNISDDVEIAFADPAGEANVIEYSSADSPVAGIGVQTSYIWVRGKSGAATLNLEAWL